MHEDTRWKVIAAAGLVTLSLAMYLVHYAVFQDAHHLFIFLVGDLAFVPIEILIVTLIVDQMLESREKMRRMEKLNLVIGTFFSNEGTSLLALLARADPQSVLIKGMLGEVGEWDTGRFLKIQKYTREHPGSTDIDRINLYQLKQFLIEHEEFVLRIVENPMVFEHESFTSCILALGHLTEEIKAREDLKLLPGTDRAHLERDINRVYTALICEWIRYMEYIHGQYPYLFSLAMRKNPFDESASVVVME
ncbi:MAG: hypothetical protein WC342_07795 [Methanoregula sp.]|jgi:hypothetical protein